MIIKVVTRRNFWTHKSCSVRLPWKRRTQAKRRRIHVGTATLERIGSPLRKNTSMALSKSFKCVSPAWNFSPERIDHSALTTGTLKIFCSVQVSLKLKLSYSLIETQWTRFDWNQLRMKWKPWGERRQMDRVQSETSCGGGGGWHRPWWRPPTMSFQNPGRAGNVTWNGAAPAMAHLPWIWHLYEPVSKSLLEFEQTE